MDILKQRISFLIHRANKIKGTDLPVPKIKLFTHSSKAGIAEKNYTNNQYTIFINKELYERDIGFVLTEILPHEVAHIILFQKNVVNHCKEWKDLCKALGGSGSIIVYPNIQLFGRAIHYQYRVNQYPSVWVNKRHHKILQKNTKQLAINNKEPFVFIGKEHYTGKTVKGNPHDKQKRMAQNIT